MSRVALDLCGMRTSADSAPSILFDIEASRSFIFPDDEMVSDIRFNRPSSGGLLVRRCI